MEGIVLFIIIATSLVSGWIPPALGLWLHDRRMKKLLAEARELGVLAKNGEDKITTAVKEVKHALAILMIDAGKSREDMQKLNRLYLEKLKAMEELLKTWEIPEKELKKIKKIIKLSIETKVRDVGNKIDKEGEKLRGEDGGMMGYLAQKVIGMVTDREN